MFRLKGHAQCRFSHSICIGGLIYTKQWATTISPFIPQEETPGRNLVIFVFGGCPFGLCFLMGVWNARVSRDGAIASTRKKKKKKNSTGWGGWNVLSNVCPPPVPYSNLRCQEAPCVMRSPMPRFVFHPPLPVISILQWLVHFLYVPRKWA